MIKTMPIDKLKNRNFISKNTFESRKDVISKCLFGSYISNAEFSIVIPTYNRIIELKTCLESIVNQKTSRVFQILVVDNCPNHLHDPAVLNMIQSFDDKRIMYFVNEINLGAMGNWNRCFFLANTDLVAMIHDDDVVNENWAETMINTYEKNPNADCISCTYQSITAHDNLQEFIVKKQEKINTFHVDMCMMLKEFKAPLLGALLKKNFFITLGGFQPELTNFEDYIFMTTACYYGNVYLCDVPLYGYMIYSGNDSNSVGLWDDVLIGQYYMRKQIIQIHTKKKLINNILNEYRLVDSVEKHNFRNGMYTGFLNTNVNSKYIYINCELRIPAILFFSFIARLRLVIKSGVNR